MDNQYNSKALKKYNANKKKLQPLINSNLSVKKTESNILDLKTNKWLLNGKCRVCNLEDRTCRCLRFAETTVEKICYCGNKECEFDCAVLVCGCIDICRRHLDYRDDYY